jgi:gliding motility-associated lipoprotein GldH
MFIFRGWKGLKKDRVLTIAASFLICVALLAGACQTIDLYEKTVSIPGHAWKNSYRPEFTFEIKDTVSSYRLYLVLRHNERYNYSNIYVNLHARQPGVDTVQSIRYDLRLATNDEGWLGSGMDDIYEHRIPLTPTEERFFFRKPGEYTFVIEQIMREDPLENVFNVGLRIEKESQ